MSQPHISEEAVADLDEIWLYIARGSVRAADRVLDEIYEAMIRLNKMPHIGHLREDLAREPLRFWPVRSYLIIYRPDRRPIEIVRVISGYRDIGELLQGSR